MKTLYKRDSKNNVRLWKAEVKGPQIHTTFGAEFGKQTEHIITCTAKNIGRANETTPEQQAIIECEALYTKKLERDGYTEELDAPNATIRPMLALDYNLTKRSLRCEKLFISPKMDGVRAIWRPDLNKFQSRKGTLYDLPLLEKRFKGIHHTFDGELYIHGLPLNQIVSAVKKTNANTPLLDFIIFDIVERNNKFSNRYRLYKAVAQKNNLTWLEQTVIANKPDVIEARLKDYIKEGYEGIMLRTDGFYETGKRSQHLRKYKKFKENEFQIIGIKPDRMGQAIMICQTEDKTFDCRCKGTNSDREYQLANQEQFIGKQLTVRYFALTEYGVPQFPVGITVRDY